jgi:hypothetical protein
MVCSCDAKKIFLKKREMTMIMTKKNMSGLFLVFAMAFLVLFSGCIENKTPGGIVNLTTTAINTTTTEECTYSSCSLDDLYVSSTKTSVISLVATTTTKVQNDDDTKVELYHFHRPQQCYSCITVGALAEKTVNTYFQDGLSSGKIVFDHVNIQLPENRELVDKYGATGSSLWIGTYINGKFHKEQNINVWYKINDENDYLSYLKEILEKRLSGDLA